MPALPQLYPYKAGPIEPIVLPDETVGIWVNKQYSFYKVDYIEGIPRSDPLEYDFGAIAAQANTAVGQFLVGAQDILAMPNSEFGQFRAAVIDDISVTLYQGRADQRHRTANRVATYTKFTDLFDPDGHNGEFYVFEKNYAYGQAFNQTDYAVLTARMIFWGFRYVLTELPQYSWTAKPQKVPATWTRVPATAHL
jgi:hypothetical protein